MAIWIINDTLKEFSTKQFYSNRMISHESFNVEIEAVIEELKFKTLTDVQHTDWFVSRIFTQTRLMSALNTNYFTLVDYDMDIIYSVIG